MLSIEGLCYTVGGRRILDGVSLRFAAGSINLVTGPNGAGKTTLLRCLAGLERLESGRIHLRGTEVDPFSADWKSSVALVPDDNALLGELTVREHVELSCALAAVSPADAQARVRPLLELFDLVPYEHHRADELSFGYRKRLAIALSLAHPAAVWLLDEPLVGLDAASLGVFQSVLSLLRSRSRVVVIASHIVEPLASLADELVALRDGHAASGAPPASSPPAPLDSSSLPWLS